MPLFQRSSAPRAPKQRVFLSRADRKTVNTLRPIERTIGVGAAVYGAIGSVGFLSAAKGGFSAAPVWRLPLALVLCALLGLMAWRTNRWLAGIGAIGVVYGVPWGTVFIAALPVLGYFVWLNLRIFKDQRTMIERRTEEGNFGVDPRVEAEMRRKGKGNERATEVAGKTLATASKRYTPPKAAKRK